jgi:hypothetical protein
MLTSLLTHLRHKVNERTYLCGHTHVTNLQSLVRNNSEKLTSEMGLLRYGHYKFGIFLLVIWV